MDEIKGGSVTVDQFRQIAESFEFRNMNTKRASVFFADAASLIIPKGEYKLFASGRGQGQGYGTDNVTGANKGVMSKYDTTEDEKDGQVQENSVFIATGLKAVVAGYDVANNRGKLPDFENELGVFLNARANIELKTGTGQKLLRLDATLKELVDVAGYEAIYIGVQDNTPIVKPAIGDGFYDLAPEYPYFKNKSKREIVLNVLQDIVFPAAPRGLHMFLYMKGIEVLDIGSMFE